MDVSGVSGSEDRKPKSEFCPQNVPRQTDPRKGAGTQPLLPGLSWEGPLPEAEVPGQEIPGPASRHLCLPKTPVPKKSISKETLAKSDPLFRPGS